MAIAYDESRSSERLRCGSPKLQRSARRKGCHPGDRIAQVNVRIEAQRQEAAPMCVLSMLSAKHGLEEVFEVREGEVLRCVMVRSVPSLWQLHSVFVKLT